MIGVVAVGAILAAGFGVLGGRGSPSAGGGIAHVPSIAPPPTPVYTGEQLEAPSVPCQPAGQEVPGLILSVSGRAIPGDAEVLEWLGPGPPVPTPAAPRDVANHDPVDVRSDLVTDIRTVGDVCAVEWLIQLVDHEGGAVIPMESMGNPTHNPLIALQNRFWLLLAQHRGRQVELQATITFPNVVVRSRWSIRILPFQAPSARLTWNDQELDLEQGCEVQLVLASGWSEALHPCFADVDRAPETVVIKRSVAPLRFRFWEGWGIDGPTVECGQLADDMFERDPACNVVWEASEASVIVTPPVMAGTWILAISTCGTQELADATNQVCGTWYTSIQVKP